jgi:predicted dehydrogenase
VKRVLLVGAGRVSSSHLTALELLPTVEVVAGVDIFHPEPLYFRQRPLEIYRDLPAAIEEQDPDVVVVATPTPTHVALCHRVIDLAPKVELLVEKPLSTSALDAAKLISRATDEGTTLQQLFHMAFAPEVLWAARRVASGDLGPVRSITSTFSDPYLLDQSSYVPSLVSSWFDSGPNALSVLCRFVDVIEVTSLKDVSSRFSTYEASVSFRSRTRNAKKEQASLTTSWDAFVPDQSTTLYFDHDTSLVMHHTSVTAWLEVASRRSESFAPKQKVSRRDSHYINLYQSWQADPSSIVVPGTTSITQWLSYPPE